MNPLTEMKAVAPTLRQALARHPLVGRDLVKMNGAGNVILVLDLRGAGYQATPEDARAFAAVEKLAYDQLMVLYDPHRPGDDAFMTIYNQDGSLSASCGNGTRCVAHYLAEQTGAATIKLATSAGELVVRREAPLSFTVDMGRPRLDWRDIPLSHAVEDMRAIDLGQFGLPPASCVSMGNPHAIFFVSDVDAYDLATIGPVLEHDPLFPQRANISLAQALSPEHVRLKVWERGAGQTLACGTAACATLVAGFRAGVLQRRATVNLPGGSLVIAWREADDHVEMTGPVEFEFVEKIHAGFFPPPDGRA